MQPLHDDEARWFYEWDRLEIMRMAGICIAIVFSAFALARRTFICSDMPDEYILLPIVSGILILALSLILDMKNGPMGRRRIICRVCKAKTRVGMMQTRHWKCLKCGTRGRFDNLPPSN
jgi:hypothetical protein